VIAAEPAPYTATRIAGIVQAALRGAGLLGVLPTPLDALRRTAGIALVDAAPLRADVLGATWFEARTIYVDPAQSPSRRRFTQAHELAGMPCEFETVRTLAAAHGASPHATLHHFVQADPRPVAMLAVGRFPAKDGALPVWRGVESPAFRTRHGPALGIAPDGVRPGSALHALVERARTGDVTPVHLGAGGSRLRLEAHYNRHAFLVLVAEAPTSARRG